MQLEAMAEKAYQANSVSDTSNVEATRKALNKQLTKTAKTTAAEKKGDGFIGDCPACQCEKCRKRRYQDGSNDSRVSFQMPTVMDPVKAKTKVMAHEMEHVRAEQHKAKQEGKVVISQSVRIMNDRCEECGTSYVKGGFTRTVTRPSLVEFRKVVAGTLDNGKSGKKLIGMA